MNKLLIFLFGAFCGAAGMMLWLRNDIKNELEEQKKAENDDENVPFTVENGSEKGSGGGKMSEKEVPVALRKETLTQYNKIISDNYAAPMTVPVPPREEKNGSEEEKKEDFVEFIDDDGPIIDIDQSTFEHDHNNEKERLVYYLGDRIMATESGTIIPNPGVLVGNNWEQYVGRWCKNTAFIRNPKLVTDYEIFVETGLYSDEYGFDDINLED